MKQKSRNHLFMKSSWGGSIFLNLLYCDPNSLHKKMPTSDGAKRRPVAGRVVVTQGKLKVCKISTHDNPADMMTKSVPVAKFELYSNLVGLTA